VKAKSEQIQPTQDFFNSRYNSSSLELRFVLGREIVLFPFCLPFFVSHIHVVDMGYLSGRRARLLSP
jgi:hypothetical protein